MPVGRPSLLLPRILAAAPTAAALAASGELATEAITSLGITRGADRLAAIADAVVLDHAGEMPDSVRGLMSLPGVGAYLASTILVYGSGSRSVILDTGTYRLAKRLRGRPEETRWQARVDLQRLAGAPGPDAEFNSALSDLAALVCRNTDPRCADCPVRRHCATGGAQATRLRKLRRS